MRSLAQGHTGGQGESQSSVFFAHGPVSLLQARLHPFSLRTNHGLLPARLCFFSLRSNHAFYQPGSTPSHLEAIMAFYQPDSASSHQGPIKAFYQPGSTSSHLEPITALGISPSVGHLAGTRLRGSLIWSRAKSISGTSHASDHTMAQTHGTPISPGPTLAQRYPLLHDFHIQRNNTSLKINCP